MMAKYVVIAIVNWPGNNKSLSSLYPYAKKAIPVEIAVNHIVITPGCPDIDVPNKSAFNIDFMKVIERQTHNCSSATIIVPRPMILGTKVIKNTDNKIRTDFL